MVFADGIATVFGAGQEEKLFLDVGGEVEEVHDLRHSGAGDMPEPGQLGVVLDLATLG